MKLILVGAVIMLSGCQSMMNQVAAYYDSQDPCLTQTPMPEWCGSSRDNTYVYDQQGKTVMIIKPNSVFVNR